MKKRFLHVSSVVALGALAMACEVTEGPVDGFGGGDPVGTGSGAGTSGPVSVFDLGSETVTDTGSDTEIELEIPSGAQSFALVVDGAGSELIVASKVTSPSDQVVYDFNADVELNRTNVTDGLYTLLVPTNPAVEPEAGTWLVELQATGEVDVGLRLVTKNEPATENMIDLNLYFVGLGSLDAATAETDTAFQEVLSNVSATYQGIGIGTRAITYNDITGGDADTYGVIDSDAELQALCQLSPQESNRSVNLFFVADISTGELGLAAGVPGPPILQGTPRSGVIVNMSSYMAAFETGDMTMLAEAAEEVERIVAHETGHFLGLYHTVERNGLDLTPSGSAIQGEDPLSDTTTCPDSADADGDGFLRPDECMGQGADNLMFWSPPVGATALTSQQGQIISANPVTY